MLAVGPFGLGPFELLLILGIVVLVFGVGKMADIGGALGTSIKEFRKAAKEEPEAGTAQAQADGSAPAVTQDAPAAPTACSKCSAQLAPQAKFCAECGTSVQAAVS